LDTHLQKAIITGAERVAAWSAVLDEINVFPVADGDTGRNLNISLSPLRKTAIDPQKTVERLLLAARGNSGNIAARFFSGFITATAFENLPEAARKGRDLAWKAVRDPVPGTMLSVFDSFAGFLSEEPPVENDTYLTALIDQLAATTLETREQLPRLQRAGVVDAGALGMFIYLEGFLRNYFISKDHFFPIGPYFKEALDISDSFEETDETGYCVDTVIRIENGMKDKLDRLTETDDSVVVMADRDFVKVHLHTGNIESTRQRLESIGKVVRWAEDHIGKQIEAFQQKADSRPIHIITDAAGSLTREDARRMGITLLDSYITVGDHSLQETLYSAEELYSAMRNGVKVSTAQASDFERQQIYQRVLDRHEQVLYLSVGSVYTGNYSAAVQFKKDNCLNDCFTVIDTTAASGRLGLIVLATARFADQTDDPRSVIEFSSRIIEQCDEYIFLDRLKYLAAGGRLSKKNAFFGDMLNIKPVVSPKADGARKVGDVRSRRGQVRFALEQLEKALPAESAPLIMLEYSDNKSWVDDVVKPEIVRCYPDVELILQPLSLTSGAHMGPGTWAMAFMANKG
jgi:DegV family protein with EDD domain